MTGVGNAAPARSAFSAFQRTTASVAQPSMMVLIALGMACFGHRAIGGIIEAQTGKETRMPGKKSPAKVVLRKRPSTTGKIRAVFSAEERAAMKDRVQETKAAARRGDRAGDESAVLAKIAQMQEADRAKAERLHAIITASAPSLAPKLWYGIRKMTRSSVFSRARRSSRHGTRRSASATRRNWTTAKCGRPLSRWWS